MCFVKYPHKKKKLNAAWAAKKKDKLSSSDKFLSKFFNNVKSTFNKTDDNATTLSFMFVIGSHLMSVWIVDTEASDHLCSTCKFFLIYEPISRSLKTVNEPAQIIEKSMVSLCLVHSDSGIQEVILKDIMHASDSSANLVLTAACAWWYLFWHVWLHLTSQNNVIEYASEVNRIFQLHLDNTPQSHAFAANCEFKVLFDMWHWRLSHLGHTNIERLFKIIDSIDLKNLSWWHDVCELCMKVKQTCLLQCFYWVSDLIIRSYSFECCWTHNAHCLWQFKVVCYPYWQLHKVYLNVFHENQRQDSQAYQELCHIDEDWLFWLFFKMPSHWLWV
jgi:hypothetical protein